jgi:hypothetical protein
VHSDTRTNTGEPYFNLNATLTVSTLHLLRQVTRSGTGKADEHGGSARATGGDHHGLVDGLFTEKRTGTRGLPRLCELVRQTGHRITCTLGMGTVQWAHGSETPDSHGGNPLRPLP